MMVSLHCRRGFSLVELAIVLGVVSIIVAGIWNYAGSARQTARIQQAMDAVAVLVDATRTTYATQSGIIGGVPTVVPRLVQTGGVPPSLLNNTTTTCNLTPSTYLISPLVSNATAGCGTLAVCDWPLGQTACATTAGSGSLVQYFAIEFGTLDYASCVTLVQRITPILPVSGLKDIYINGNPSASLGGLPIPYLAASSTAPYVGLGCTPNVSTNTLDFVYVLRTPST